MTIDAIPFRPKVGLIGIGVQKAATSWMHHVLSSHPAITTPSVKETDFFIARYDRGSAWYEALFPNGQLCAEFSPNYFTSRDAIDRIHAYNPEVRLLAILRDPVERAFSNYLHELRKGHIPLATSFDKALEGNQAYVEQGRYGKHLSRWMNRFGPRNCHVVLAEDIAVAPREVFRGVCRFLCIDETVVPEEIDRKRHESIGARNNAAQRVLRKGGDILRHAGRGHLLESVKEAPVIRQILEKNRVNLRLEIDPMTAETRARLTDEFFADVAWVSDLLGRDLPWANFSGPQDQGVHHA